MKKEEKEGFIMTLIIILAFAFSIVYAVYTAPPISNPTKTFYLVSNLFPLKAYEYAGGGNILFLKYAFYGTPQANGT